MQVRNMIRSSFVVFLFCGLFFQHSNSVGAETKKKRKRPSPVVSPTFHEGGEVTFRLQASQAREVLLTGEMLGGKRMEMDRGEDGMWSKTIDPVDPGIYGYSFIVDGLKILDPGNPSAKPMRSPKTSILHIAGENVFDLRDVPHGTLHTHGYHSKPIERYREISVYTPPGYESGSQSYPLLILQHGHSDTYQTWTEYGKAHWILDNLIASGEVEPMIVLMADGHPIPESYGNARMPENTTELRADLMEAAIPLVESIYRIKPGRENRAIAGLSMGGLHALTIGLKELDSFAWIGAFSAAVPDHQVIEEALNNPKNTNDRLNRLWIAIGKKDFLLQENLKLTEKLTDGGIDHDWLLNEGGHSWPVWRDYLARFAPILFK